jgi:hypothetical protein
MPAAVATLAFYWGSLILFGHTGSARMVAVMLRRRARRESPREVRGVAALALADANPRPSFVTSTSAG